MLRLDACRACRPGIKPRSKQRENMLGCHDLSIENLAMFHFCRPRAFVFAHLISPEILIFAGDSAKTMPQVVNFSCCHPQRKLFLARSAKAGREVTFRLITYFPALLQRPAISSSLFRSLSLATVMGTVSAAEMHENTGTIQNIVVVFQNARSLSSLHW